MTKSDVVIEFRTMKHNLELLNGEAVLLATLLTIPEQFKDTGEHLRAAYILTNIELKLPEAKDQLDAWAREPYRTVEFTEAQRDLVKKVITNNIEKIPPSLISKKLLEQFGFTE